MVQLSSNFSSLLGSWIIPWVRMKFLCGLLYKKIVKIELFIKCINSLIQTVKETSVTRILIFPTDVPHVIETASNCLANFGISNGRRYMWNDRYYVLRYHNEQIYKQEVLGRSKALPKLNNNHIYLTSYSIMAVEVLSKSATCFLRKFELLETTGTAKYCEMMDNLFWLS